MAILSIDRLARIRNEFVQAFPDVTTKPVLNAAAQAVEDWFEANRAALGTAINAATIPLGITLTSAQKVQIVKHWLFAKFEAGG